MRELAETFSYDPETGILTWNHDARNGRARAGDVAGVWTKNGYKSVTWGGRPYLAHRVAWYLTHNKWPDAHIDHINGDKADNRLCNLREATHSQNVMNCGPSAANRSGVRGVYFVNREQKWEVSLCVEGRRRKFGTYRNFEDAVRARRDAEAKYFGKFARLASLDEKLAAFNESRAR